GESIEHERIIRIRGMSERQGAHWRHAARLRSANHCGQPLCPAARARGVRLVPSIGAGVLTLRELAGIAGRHSDALDLPVREFDVGGRAFAFNARPAIMGVINLSPDSWYRESVALSVEAAIRRGCVLAAAGADIIDIGAESTLPEAARADSAQQNLRLLPVLRGLRERGILVSVETYQPEVARTCLEAGANVLNLTGVDRDGEILRIAADHDAAGIRCHVEGEHVRAVGDYLMDPDPVGRMLEAMARGVERAERAGVRRLFVDPGLGFYYGNLKDSAERVRHQMTV